MLTDFLKALSNPSTGGASALAATIELDGIFF